MKRIGLLLLGIALGATATVGCSDTPVESYERTYEKSEDPRAGILHYTNYRHGEVTIVKYNGQDFLIAQSMDGISICQVIK